MKLIGKLIFEKYLMTFLGLVIGIIGYAFSFFVNLDLTKQINSYLEFTEQYEINEVLFIWIFIFLIFAFLNFVDLLKKRLFLQKKKVYVSMLYSTNHIIKNLLYQIQIMRIEAEKDPSFDKQIIRMFDASIEEAQILVDKLSKIKNIDAKDIYNSIKPLEQKESWKF